MMLCGCCLRGADFSEFWQCNQATTVDRESVTPLIIGSVSVSVSVSVCVCARARARVRGRMSVYVSVSVFVSGSGSDMYVCLYRMGQLQLGGVRLQRGTPRFGGS